MSIGGYNTDLEGGAKDILKTMLTLDSLPEDTHIFPSTESTKLNFSFLQAVDSENIIMKEFKEKYWEILLSDNYIVPSLLKDER